MALKGPLNILDFNDLTRVALQTLRALHDRGLAGAVLAHWAIPQISARK